MSNNNYKQYINFSRPAQPPADFFSTSSSIFGRFKASWTPIRESDSFVRREKPPTTSVIFSSQTKTHDSHIITTAPSISQDNNYILKNNDDSMSQDQSPPEAIGASSFKKKEEEDLLTYIPTEEFIDLAKKEKDINNIKQDESQSEPKVKSTPELEPTSSIPLYSSDLEMGQRRVTGLLKKPSRLPQINGGEISGKYSSRDLHAPMPEKDDGEEQEVMESDFLLFIKKNRNPLLIILILIIILAIVIPISLIIPMGGVMDSNNKEEQTYKLACADFNESTCTLCSSLIINNNIYNSIILIPPSLPIIFVPILTTESPLNMSFWVMSSYPLSENNISLSFYLVIKDNNNNNNDITKTISLNIIQNKTTIISSNLTTTHYFVSINSSFLDLVQDRSGELFDLVFSVYNNYQLKHICQNGQSKIMRIFFNSSFIEFNNNEILELSNETNTVRLHYPSILPLPDMILISKIDDYSKDIILFPYTFDDNMIVISDISSSNILDGSYHIILLSQLSSVFYRYLIEFPLPLIKNELRIINEISPNSFSSSSLSSDIITLLGTGFYTTLDYNITSSVLRCRSNLISSSNIIDININFMLYNNSIEEESYIKLDILYIDLSTVSQPIPSNSLCLIRLLYSDGYILDSPIISFYNNIQIIDIPDKTLSISRSLCTSLIIKINKNEMYLLAFGGRNENMSTIDSIEYIAIDSIWGNFIPNSQWKILSQTLPIPLEGMTIHVIKDNIHLFGGYNENSGYSTNYYTTKIIPRSLIAYNFVSSIRLEMIFNNNENITNSFFPLISLSYNPFPMISISYRIVAHHLLGQSNPGGISISDISNIIIPKSKWYSIKIKWKTPIDSVCNYDIYRSINPNNNNEWFKLTSAITTNEYLDINPIQSILPISYTSLPYISPFSFNSWFNHNEEGLSLAFPRSYSGSVLIHDFNIPSRYMTYIIGGMDSHNNARNDAEIYDHLTKTHYIDSILIPDNGRAFFNVFLSNTNLTDRKLYISTGSGSYITYDPLGQTNQTFDKHSQLVTNINITSNSIINNPINYINFTIYPYWRTGACFTEGAGGNQYYYGGILYSNDSINNIATQEICKLSLDSSRNDAESVECFSYNDIALPRPIAYTGCIRRNSITYIIGGSRYNGIPSNDVVYAIG